jgi:hypothetical protein
MFENCLTQDGEIKCEIGLFQKGENLADLGNKECSRGQKSEAMSAATEHSYTHIHK